MRVKLMKMQKEYLIDLEDAVVAVKDDKGKINWTTRHRATPSMARAGGTV